MKKDKLQVKSKARLDVKLSPNDHCHWVDNKVRMMI